MNLFNGSDADVLLWTLIGVIALVGVLGTAVALLEGRRRRNAETMRRLRNF